MWAKRVCLALSLIFTGSALAQAQTGRVTGTVVDSATSNPIANARVAVVGTTLLSGTDSDGRFSLNNVPAGAQQLRFTRIGFAPVTRSITVGAGATSSINVTMHTQAVQLNPVVSVGYGTQRLSDVTGAVSSVNTDVLDKTPIATVDQMLQGTSPGVQVTTASSAPGGAISIRIRGASSITGNSEPLYVIDGFPIENDIEGSSVGNGGRDRTTPANPLVTLNPSEIESISILKDASATAIYGARGANGVVIITTKQGRGSKPQFSIESYTGTSKIAKTYDLLESNDYMSYANEYAQNLSTPFTPFPDSTRARILAEGINTDWQDEIFRSAVTRNVQFSVRGATSTSNNTRYAFSFGRYSQEGIVVGSGLTRLSSRLNVNQNFGERVQVGGSVSASQAKSRAVPTAGQQNGGAGAISGALQYVPILPVFRKDGSYTLLNPDLNAYGTLLDAAPAPNPVSMAREVSDSLGDTRVLGNFFADVGLMKNLKLRVSVGGDYADRFRNTYYPRTTLRGAASGGLAIRANSVTSSWINENTLTYDKRFGPHSVNLLGGFSRQRTDVDGNNASNSNFVSDITTFFDIGAGAQEGGPTVGSRRTSQTLESYLSRLNYSLFDRYLMTLTYRNDGSSRFASGKKRGGFPSAAFAWRASEESFLKGVNWLDQLKLRLSVGTVGNPSIRPYQSLARLNDQTYSFGGTPLAGYYPTSVANPNLTWESTHQVDAGFDLGVGSRMNVTFDWYRKKTTDLLLQISLPLESGFESALANRGSVENKGVELGIEADILRNVKGLRWKTNISFAKNRNKVLDLGGEPSIFADLITTDFNLPGTLIQVGQPIGVFYGFKSKGVIPDSATAATITYRNFSGGRFRAGDMWIENIDGDTLITLNDRTNIGDPTPDFTYGFSNTFTWRRFELSGLLQGQKGGKILNVNRIRTEAQPRANISRARWEDRWTPTNTDAKYPRIGENPNQVGPNNFTSNLLEDGTYLRLRTITLSYGAPAWLFGARLYVTGTNLLTWTDYSGFDPDVSGQSVGNTNRGIDIGAYPLARTIIAGLNINY